MREACGISIWGAGWLVAMCAVAGCAQAGLPDESGDGGVRDGGDGGGGGGGSSGGGSSGGGGGSCNPACVNPHGTTRCDAAHRTCVPSCDPGWAVCGAVAAGCTTATDGDLENCGGCGRRCDGDAPVTTRQCFAGHCAPTCMFPYSDCSRPDAPDADDGCETNGKNDPDEGDDLCNGHQLSVAEGASATAGESRILPSGDTDVIHVRLNEGNHTCVPLSSQSYHARIEVIAPAGTDLRPGYNFGGSCNNTWRTDLASPICYDWGGTCIADDSKDLYFQIYGQDQANSCLPYQLVVTFAAEGTKVPGCP